MSLQMMAKGWSERTSFSDPFTACPNRPRRKSHARSIPCRRSPLTVDTALASLAKTVGRVAVHSPTIPYD